MFTRGGRESGKPELFNLSSIPPATQQAWGRQRRVGRSERLGSDRRTAGPVGILLLQERAARRSTERAVEVPRVRRQRRRTDGRLQRPQRVEVEQALEGAQLPLSPSGVAV